MPYLGFRSQQPFVRYDAMVSLISAAVYPESAIVAAHMAFGKFIFYGGRSSLVPRYPAMQSDQLPTMQPFPPTTYRLSSPPGTRRRLRRPPIGKSYRHHLRAL